MMKFTIPTLLCLVIILDCNAQLETVSGVVKSSIDNSPIQNAEIWNDNNPNVQVQSLHDGKFELSTSKKRFLLMCDKDSFNSFGKWVTPPEHNLEIVLTPESPKPNEIELIISVKNEKNQLLDSIKYQFENIIGFDRFTIGTKQDFNIPIEKITSRNDILKLNIERKGYKILNDSIFFYEYEKQNKNKGIVFKMQLDSPNPDSTNLGLKINSAFLISVALYSGTSWLINKEKANDLYPNISPSLSEQKVNEWGDYIKYKTRSNLMGLTAINSTISSLPFILDWSNANLNIDKRLLSGIYFIGSIAFITSGIISGNKANDINTQLNSTYSQLSDARVTKMGDYQMYKERERLFYINAAIDLSTAINTLIFFNRNNEMKAKTHVSVLFNIPSNNYYSSSFCLNIKKQL